MSRAQTWPLAGVIESSQLLVPQRERPVASFHVRAGAWEQVSQLRRLGLPLTLLSHAPVTPGSTGRQQRGPEAIGTRAQRLACSDRPPRSDARERP
jgi:hypothetical protein